LGDIAVLGMVIGLPSIVALRSPLEGEFDLGKDSFTWSHPTCSSEALLMVDDAAKRVAREVASQGRKGVQTTLAKMSDMIVVVARLGTEARRQMTDEVAVQAHMSLLVF
jgi:hypothetical protein